MFLWPITVFHLIIRFVLLVPRRYCQRIILKKFHRQGPMKYRIVNLHYFKPRRRQSLKKGDKQTNKNKQAILQPSSTNKLGQETNKSTTFANLYLVGRAMGNETFYWEGLTSEPRQTRVQRTFTKLFPTTRRWQ